MDQELKEKLKSGGIVGLIAILVGFGGTQTLTQEQIDDTYVCSMTEELGVFDRLSDSGITGYYTINGTEESERCNEGYDYGAWIPLETYAEEQGVSVQEFLKEESEPNTGNTTQVCGRQGCFTCKAPVDAYSDCEGTIDSAGEIISPGKGR